ncbi:MAG: N-formylglutamate amidohydrolase [Ardenticatenaceae bacterium]|nr:N-formylglutamate amidohydrolase [Ardenticatenaceae bacterium]
MAEKLPIAIVIPHAGLALPPELAARVALTPAQIFNEADVYVDQLFDFREAVLHWVCFPYARALLDVNRPDDTALTRPGDGIVKWQTSYGTAVYPPHQIPDADLTRQLTQRYWQSWHEQLATVARDERVKLVIDAHSMAAVGPGKYDDPGKLRPSVSVGNLGDTNGEPVGDRPWRVTAVPDLTRRFAQRLGELLADVPVLAEVGAETAVNDPFYGGYDLMAHGQASQPWLMIEVNRALYVGAQDGDTPPSPPNAAQIALIRQRLWQAILDLLSWLG